MYSLKVFPILCVNHLLIQPNIAEGPIRSYHFVIKDRYVPFISLLPSHTAIYNQWPSKELRTHLPEYLSTVTTIDVSGSPQKRPNVLMGKPVHVVESDRLEMTIKNELQSTGLSIHFHGFEMANAIEYDGVVGLTQCPLSPDMSFTYNFTVDEDPGTYWYHTHSGNLNIESHNMLKAPIIVHPDTEASRLLVNKLHKAELREYTDSGIDYRPLISYDNERILFFSDGFLNSENKMEMYAIGGLHPPAQENDDGFVAANMEHQFGTVNGKLREIIHVVKGETYKFRLINGGSHFSYRVSIDGFKMNVIATDSSLVEKFEVDEVIIHTGERFDVEIEVPTTLTTGDRFWIRADTQESREHGYQNGIRAVLHIVDSMNVVDTIDDIDIFDPLPYNVFKGDKLVEERVTINCYSHLEMIAAESNKKGACLPITILRYQNKNNNNLKHNTTAVHTVDFDVSGPPIHAHFTRIDNGNWYQFASGSKSHMLQSDFDAGRDLHPHSAMLQVPAFSSVILIWRSTTIMDHPMHLHGYKMEILDVKLADRSKDCTLVKCKLIDDFNLETKIEELKKLNVGSRPLKDTFIMPAGGAVVTRISTHKPAPWLAHCHMEIHREDGMAFILNVGNYTAPTDNSWLPKDFPDCQTLFLRSKSHEMPHCDCYVDNDAVLGLTLDQTYKCSRPYLCMYEQSQVAILTKGKNLDGFSLESSYSISNWNISIIVVVIICLCSLLISFACNRYSKVIKPTLVKKYSSRKGRKNKRISMIDLKDIKSKTSKPSFMDQLLNLTYTQWCEYRPGAINYFRVVEVCGLGILAGLLFQDVGSKNTATGLGEKTSLLFFSTTLWSQTRMYPAIGNYFEWSHKDFLSFKHKKYGLFAVFLSRTIVVIFCEAWWPLIFIFCAFPLASIFGNIRVILNVCFLLALNNCCYIAIGAMFGTVMSTIHLAMIVSTLYGQTTVICAGFFTKLPQTFEFVRITSPIFHTFKGIVKLVYKWDDTYDCVKGQSAVGPTQCFLEQSALIDDYKQRGINVATFGDPSSAQVLNEYIALTILFMIFQTVMIFYHLVKRQMSKKTSVAVIAAMITPAPGEPALPEGHENLDEPRENEMSQCDDIEFSRAILQLRKKTVFLRMSK